MNKFIGLGRLTKDPETRFSQNNVQVTRFTIAINRPGKNQDPPADFFDIVTFKGTAEFAGKYFKKGMQVLVEGYLRNNSWQDQQGNKRMKTEINAEHVYFADSRRDDATQSHPDYGGSQVPASGYGEESQPFNGEDEDLPF